MNTDEEQTQKLDTQIGSQEAAAKPKTLARGNRLHNGVALARSQRQEKNPKPSSAALV
jgi:hypothetical protein